MSHTTLAISDMHCSSCVAAVRHALDPAPGVRGLQFNPVRRRVIVEHSADLTPSELVTRLETAGFAPSVLSIGNAAPTDRGLLMRLGIAGLCLMQVMTVHIALYAGDHQGMSEPYRLLLQWSALAFSVPVVCYSAVPFLRGAGTALRMHTLTMDVPVALAIALAFGASLVATITGTGAVYYDSVAMFTFLLLGTRYVDGRLRARFDDPPDLLPTAARNVTRIAHGARTVISAEEVCIGDELWIAEGEQLSADGVLLDASASVDEALLTGEPHWSSRVAGDTLYAGTFNRGGAFSLQVTAPVSQSRLAGIDRLASAALAQKHSLTSITDQLARFFTPAILLIAAVTATLWLLLDASHALTTTLAVLVASCPCALSLAAPSALQGAMVRLRRAGIIVRDVRALERLHRVRHVAFDKTGTLTAPSLQVVASHNLSPYADSWCWEVACAVQARTSHPLAAAFQATTPLRAENVTITAGAGLTAHVAGHRVALGSADFCGFTTAATDRPEVAMDRRQVYLQIDGKPAVIYDLEEALRPDAAAAINDLQSLGISVRVLTGDQREHCHLLDDLTSISYQAQLTPEQKPLLLSELADADGSVLFVGDGMNDIPALAEADISLSTLEATDLVRSKADIVLLTTKLCAVADMLRVGQSLHRTIRQNLTWAGAYNAIAIPLAAFGYAPPWAAALGMAASSLIVIGNASRLLRRTRTQALVV